MRSLKRINITSVFIVLLLMVFLLSPFASFKRVVYIYPLFGLWFISTLGTKWIGRATGLLLCLLLITLLHLFLSNQSDYSFSHFISFNLPTALWSICFVYYSRKIDDFKSLVPIILLVFLISSVLTIRANIVFPGASRYLATSSTSEWSDLRDTANSLFCGGYDFIFAIPFLLFSVMVLWKYRLILPNLIFYFLFAVFIVCVIVGSYFTAIILTIVSIILSRIPTNRIGLGIIVLLGAILLVFLFKDVFLQWLIDVGIYIDSPMLTKRAEQALYGTYISDYSQNQEIDRFERMKNALINIERSPFFGRLNGDVINPLPSGHSEFLGYFEDFGIFGFIYVFFYFEIYRTIKRCFKTLIISRFFTLFYLLFLVFIIIDKFDVATGTAAVTFLISPLILLLVDNHLVNHVSE